MTRARLLLGLLGLLVMLGASSLLGWALVRAAAEDEVRHGVLAERVFDGLEAELSELVQREEQRSFLEYRHYYVPGRQALGSDPSLVRSPLAELPPADGVIVGWFQVDPDGAIHLPHEPRESEAALASADRWSADERLETARPLLEAGATAARDGLRQEPEVPPVAVAVQQESTYEAWQSTIGSSLNRGASKRSGRSTRKVATPSQNIVGFTDNRAVDLREVVSELPPLAAAPTPVDVEVGPLVGIEGSTPVLARRVVVDGETFVQGLVLDRSRLRDALMARALSPELAPYADLDWDDDGTRAFTFSHRFAEPFADEVAWLALDRVPGATTTVWPLVVLTGLLGLALAVGALALDRMVGTELAFAQRRSDFVAAVSHELKTPLTAIRMYAEMLRDGMVLSDEHRQGYYETMAAETERLSRLIANVLELGRLERGAAGEVVVGDAGAVLDEVATILGPHVRDQGFTLELDLPEQLPPVRMERDGLLQVLLNLVDNAVKFSTESEDRRVTVQALTEDRLVIVKVRDRGPGIPRAQLTRVMEPFFRGERELTRTTKGTGIGLALVDGLMRRMGGRVSLRNHPQGGLEVTLQLARATPG